MQISNNNSKQSFYGITPIKVYKNGQEVLDRRAIRNSCSKVIKAFCGPLESKYKQAAAQLAVRDADYMYHRAYKGYANKFENGDAVPSDYIKIIYDKNNRGYLITGKLNEILNKLGHNIGVAQKENKSLGLSTSQKLENAKQQYWDFIKSIGNDVSLRTRATFNPYTLEKIGPEQEIIVNRSTKEQKVKGNIVEKVNIENINFIDK